MAAIRPNPTLSDDLISEILVRVPVKSLLCFQSVCKTWLSLIKHPVFVKSQLRHAITTQTDQTLMRNETFLLSVLHVDSREIVADLKFPYPRGEVKSVNIFSHIVGSANGIVCVALHFSTFHSCRTDIYLWNPAIRQSKLIPSFFNTIEDTFAVHALGFGYDGAGRDFKVVSVVMSPSYYAEVPSFRADLYSDNRNAWRNVLEPMDFPSQGTFDVCINGFLCGIGRYGDIMAFDLNQEVLNCTIKLPVIDDAHDHEEARVIEFNNSFAVIMLVGTWSIEKNINMWTLDDDACLRGGGVEASWTPLFSIDLGTPTSLIHGYFSNGNLLLVLLRYDVKMWFLCNVDKKEAKVAPPLVDMAYDRYDRVMYKYTESLVSLAGFNKNIGENDN